MRSATRLKILRLKRSSPKERGWLPGNHETGNHPLDAPRKRGISIIVLIIIGCFE